MDVRSTRAYSLRYHREYNHGVGKCFLDERRAEAAAGLGKWYTYEGVRRLGWDSLTWGDPTDTPPMPVLRWTNREYLIIGRWRI